jgi:hypothetical protein
MVSGIGEICAILWGTFGGFVVCIGCCEKITTQNSISIKSDNYYSLSNKTKDKNGKIISIQPYSLNDTL